jgi:hypothetical protein
MQNKLQGEWGILILSTIKSNKCVAMRLKLPLSQAIGLNDWLATPVDEREECGHGINAGNKRKIRKTKYHYVSFLLRKGSFLSLGLVCG